MEKQSKITLQCQKGNLQKFAELYNKYVEKIYKFIYFRTNHQTTAQDLTSLTFTKALENIKKFNPKKGTFQAWIYAIARHNVIDYYRTNKKTVNINDIWDLGEKPNLDKKIDLDQKLKQVRKKICKLDPDKRDIIIMRVWDELPYQEIAKIIGKSETNCRMIFSRAIKKLRQEIPLELLILILSTNYN